VGDFATQAQLEDLLGTTVDGDLAALALGLASDAVRSYTQQTLEPATSTVLLNATGGPVLFLHQLHVTSVDTVTEITGTTSRVETVLEEFVDFEWDRFGILERVGRNWPRQRRSVQVTYDHGHADLDPLRGPTLGAATRFVENPSGIKQESIGRYAYTFAGDGGTVGITRGEAMILDRFAVDRWTTYEPVGS